MLTLLECLPARCRAGGWCRRGLALGGPFIYVVYAFSRSGPPCPRYAQECAPEGKLKEKKALPIPQTLPPRHARDHRALFLPALGLPRPGALVGPGPSRPPALGEKSAFSSDPMKGRAWGLPLDPAGSPRPAPWLSRCA